MDNRKDIIPPRAREELLREIKASANKSAQEQVEKRSKAKKKDKIRGNEPQHFIYDEWGF